MPQVVGVILAAGKGVRMNSNLPKVLHPVAGVPMVKHVMRTARNADVDRLVLVVGHGRDLVVETLQDADVRFVVQDQQLGTGHALLQAEAEASGYDLVLVLCGDTPILKTSTLKQLIDYHLNCHASATVLTACLEQPRGYGRIIRDQNGEFERIVEEKDASPDEKLINEINSGVYCFDREVFEALKEIQPNNSQGEYYLTDALLILKDKGRIIKALVAAQEEEIHGINDRVQRAFAEKVIRERKCNELMLAGVTIIDPASTFVDTDVAIGIDTIIYPFTLLEGKTTIGENCHIGPGSRITDTVIGDDVAVDSSRVIESIIGNHCNIGPFAYLRPGSVLAEDVKVGDFVEVKKSVIGRGSKLPHLSYVGDATVGKNVNIGAGTITCNYDGEKKHPSIIEDGAFIGSNTNLVAPIVIGEGATTGAGSTITTNVPAFSLGVERAPQKTVRNWRRKKSSHNE